MRTEIALPDLALLAMTRGILGAGLGFLVAGRFDATVRRSVGLTLVAVGVLTTIPLAFEVVGGLHRRERNAHRHM